MSCVHVQRRSVHRSSNRFFCSEGEYSCAAPRRKRVREAACSCSCTGDGCIRSIRTLLRITIRTRLLVTFFPYAFPPSTSTSTSTRATHQRTSNLWMCNSSRRERGARAKLSDPLGDCFMLRCVVVVQLSSIQFNVSAIGTAISTAPHRIASHRASVLQYSTRLRAEPNTQVARK